VTGSIGVIASTVSFGELYEKVGIHTEVLKRGENSDFLNGVDSLSQSEREKVRLLITDTYDRFVNRVSDGRELAADSVYTLAQGRIYSGDHAIDVGLADRVGGIEDAIIMAKKASSIPEEEQVKLVYLPNFSMGLFDIIENPGISAEKLDLPAEIMKVLEQVDQAKLLANEQVLYMLPFAFELQNSR
jgi:protease-4